MLSKKNILWSYIKKEFVIENSDNYLLYSFTRKDKAYRIYLTNRIYLTKRKATKATQIHLFCSPLTKIKSKLKDLLFVF